MITTFGFSAYLKLASLSEKRQKTELRSRLLPRGDAYDFHRSLRLAIGRHLLENVSIEQILVSTNQIARAAERQSVRNGILQLAEWRQRHPGNIHRIAPAIYKSPASIFQVRFDIDFGINNERHFTAVHAWNTKSVELSPRMTFGALELFRSTLEHREPKVDDLAVLSLRNGRLYRLSEVDSQIQLALATVSKIETLFEVVAAELGHRPSSGREHRAPPPS